MAIALKSRRRLRPVVRPAVAVSAIAALVTVLSSWSAGGAANAADTPKDASDIPRDASGFTEHVAEQVRRELADVAVTIKGPLTLGLGGMQANLDRIYDFCRRDLVGCPRIRGRH